MVFRIKYHAFCINWSITFTLAMYTSLNGSRKLRIFYISVVWVNIGLIQTRLVIRGMSGFSYVTKLSMSIKYLLWHLSDTQSMTLGVLKSSRTTCTFPATQLKCEKFVVCSHTKWWCAQVMQSYRNPEWVSTWSSLCLNKIYNLFWIGDIKTDSMDIAFVP